MAKRQAEMAAEIISDSEPEREATRAHLREGRRLQKSIAKLTAPKIIELTDSESTDSVVLPKTRTTITIGSVSASTSPVSSVVQDGSSSLADTPPRSTFSERPRQDALPARNALDISGTARLMATAETLSAGDEKAYLDTGSEDDVEEHIVKMRARLGHFTYSSTSQGSSRLPRSSSYLSKTNTGSTSADSFGNKVSLSHPKLKECLDMCLDDAEKALDKIRRCLSCDMKWTTRKTLAQKKIHIKKCAKKNRITGETLSFLIKREVFELDSSSTGKKAKDVQLTDNPAQSSTSVTLLGGVVKASETQICRRKKGIQGSVKTMAEMRTSILSKAESFLNEPLGAGQSVKTSTVFPYPATQAFSRSKLGGQASLLRSDSDTDFINAGDSASGAEPPPSTQAFSKSMLGSRNPGRLLVEEKPTDERRISLETTLSPSRVGIMKSNDFHTGAGLFDSKTMHDEAILTFEPGETGSERNEIPLKPESNSSNALDLRKNSKTCLKKDKSPSRMKPGRKPSSALNSLEDKAKRMKNRDELSKRLEVAIREDEVLYSRILRYEPIALDVFLNMLEDHGLSKGELMYEVRKFLDQQAIHYYSTNPAGSRVRF